MTITFRELHEEDLKDYKKIRLEMLANHPKNFGSSAEEEEQLPDEHFIARLKKAHAISVGAFFSGELIGIVTLMMSPRGKMKHVATINSFYVRAPYRRKGVARKLLHHIEGLAKKEQVNRLKLVVTETNNHAHDFYLKEGYIETGKEIDAIFYNSNYHTLILMNKVIGE